MRWSASATASAPRPVTSGNCRARASPARSSHEYMAGLYEGQTAVRFGNIAGAPSRRSSRTSRRWWSAATEPGTEGVRGHDEGSGSQDDDLDEATGHQREADDRLGDRGEQQGRASGDHPEGQLADRGHGEVLGRAGAGDELERCERQEHQSEADPENRDAVGGQYVGEPVE